jgi:hypothetical protein
LKGEVIDLKNEESHKRPVISTILSMMINPKKAMKSKIDQMPWFFGVIVSGLAFGLFFLQTGLDLYRTGLRGSSIILLSVGAGLAYGLIVIPLIGALLWLILKMFKGDKTLSWTITSFSLSYSGAMIYGLIGLVFSLVFGWKTAVAFGVGGVLWATGPIITTIREITKGRSSLGIVLATIVGALVLLSWLLLSKL